MSTLRGVECVECRARGHRCQAQMWDGDKPVCLPCADDAPCAVETVGPPRAEVGHDPFCVILPLQPQAPRCRAETVIAPQMGAVERAGLLGELEYRTMAEVAARRGLSAGVVAKVWLDHAATCAVRPRIQRVAATAVGLEAVTRTVAEGLGVDPAEVVGPRRNRPAVMARHIVIFIAVTELGLSTSRVGAYLHRDHTTVMYGRDQVRRGIKSDNGLRCTVDAIVTRLFLREENNPDNPQDRSAAIV